MKTRLEDKTVRDIMTDLVFVANLHQTWGDVARKMLQKDLHHMVIVDEQHAPVGMASTFDFLAHAAQKDPGMPERRLAESYGPPTGDLHGKRKLYTVRPDQKIHEAGTLMEIHHVQCLAVVGDNGQLLGVVTPFDVVKSLLEGV